MRSPSGPVDIFAGSDAVVRTGRFLTPLFACLILAALGAAGGYLLGRSIVIDLAKARLKTYATRIMMQGEASSAESRTVLAKLNNSQYPFCSDRELAYFRGLIFESEYLKDAARIRNGQIWCTAKSGRLKNPIRLSASNFAQSDGTRVFLNMSELKVSGLQTISLQWDRSLVVFSPFNLNHMEPSPMRYAVTVVDRADKKPANLLGSLPPSDVTRLAKDGEGREGNLLYATRCSERFFNCMTAYIGINEALGNDSTILPGYTILSGVAAGLVGTAFFVLGARNRSAKNRFLRAIRKGCVDVLYQPLVNIHTRRIIGAEALIRWADYDGSTLPPQLLIKVAEEFGFVGEITELVLKRATRELADVFASNSEFRLNINVSALDLSDPIFLPMLERILAKAGIPSNRIGIELTESSTADRPLATDAILRLRRQGHYVCLDDFGTGYSSLSYLQDLAVDAIKIDRSFTKAIGTDSVSVSILPQVWAMAKSLNLQVVIEGIETEDQAGYFATWGAQVMAQGWLFGLPVSAKHLIELLDRASEREMVESSLK